MFKKLALQLKTGSNTANSAHVTSPFARELPPKNELLTTLSKKAVDLYERKSDINHFTKLVLSNPENDSHFRIVDELYADPFVDEKLAELANNERFLKDLGLI